MDSAGNSLVLFGFGTSLSWLNRRSDGTYPHPPAVLDPHLFVREFSIVSLDSERFAFTCTGVPWGTGQPDRLRLYTYGFPPDTTHVGVTHSRSVIPQTLSLTVHPNPFNSSARIGFDLPKGGPIKLEVFDETGRRVRTLMHGPQEAGHHEAAFDEDGLASGTYFVRLRAGNLTRSQKMVLVK